jgi:hypothetical protein
MQGLHSNAKEQINKVVADLFDKAALRLIGSIPKLQQKKHVLIGFEQGSGLANLFLQAMNNRWLNHIEQDVLKGILEGAYAYLDVLKNKTSNNIVQRIEGLAREARIDKDRIPQEEINKILEDELGKARSGLETIAASESTKARNLGSVMEISRNASLEGEKDPVVYFSVIRDNSTCKYCVELFLMPDKVTPRLWRLSELSAGYFKRGDTVPSILGLHPFCRCLPSQLPSDWGFDGSGKITFVAIGHDALAEQRKAD